MLLISTVPNRLISLPCCLAMVRASSLLVSAMAMASSLLHYTTTTHVAASSLTAQDILSSLFANAVEDRRLISTLVTAHATSICSLLVLIGQYRNNDDEEITRFKSIFIHLCQIFVPLELMVSWIFCILFDIHTKRVFDKRTNMFTISDYQLFSNICIGNEEEIASVQCSMVTFTHICKYIVGFFLLIELILVSMQAYHKLVVSREGGIRLYDIETPDIKVEYCDSS